MLADSVPSFFLVQPYFFLLHAADSLLTLDARVTWWFLQNHNCFHWWTFGVRLLRKGSSVAAVYSPSSLLYHSSDIMDRHLSLACRGKYLTLLMFGGYYVPFQKCVHPNPCLIPPWWIQAPDQISLQSSFGFTLCLGFIHVADNFCFFLLHNCNFLERKVPNIESFESICWALGSSCPWARACVCVCVGVCVCLCALYICVRMRKHQTGPVCPVYLCVCVCVRPVCGLH